MTYIPIKPFSPNGVASKLLTWYLTRINVNGVSVSQTNITCKGSSNCLIPLFDERIMALSALDKTHAECTKSFKGENDIIPRYTGMNISFALFIFGLLIFSD
jgi:hypothetical protein